MADENRRLVERERLDVAPTNVLGLFVVGRLARRHGLFVRLESSGERGVTAVVQIPQRPGHRRALPITRAAASTVRVRPARIARDMIDAIEVPQPYGSFPWFAAGPAAIGAAGAADAAETDAADTNAADPVTRPRTPTLTPGPTAADPE
jgi:hypothetical protein